MSGLSKLQMELNSQNNGGNYEKIKNRAKSGDILQAQFHFLNMPNTKKRKGSILQVVVFFT